MIAGSAISLCIQGGIERRVRRVRKRVRRGFGAVLCVLSVLLCVLRVQSWCPVLHGKCGSSSISLQGRQIMCRPGWAPGPSLRHGARWRSGGSAEGWDAAGGHPRFLREAQCRRSAPGAGRHRSPPRDLVDSRTARKVEATARSGRRTGASSSSTARQAPGKDAQQVEASAGRGAYTAGKVSAADSAILTVAGACDGTAAGLAATNPQHGLQPNLR